MQDRVTELRQKAQDLLEKEADKAQVLATLAMTAAIEELTNVVKRLTPAMAPDPDAGQGYKEFELDDADSGLELGEPTELELDK